RPDRALVRPAWGDRALAPPTLAPPALACRESVHLGLAGPAPARFRQAGGARICPTIVPTASKTAKSCRATASSGETRSETKSLRTTRDLRQSDKNNLPGAPRLDHEAPFGER